jgi:hypothetical protein
MDNTAKAYRHEWRGDLMILYGRHEDGSETAIAIPPGALPMMAATKPPAQQKEAWSLATPLPAEGFKVGTMPIETEPRITLEVHTSLGPPFLFSCSVEHARELGELLQEEASRPLTQGQA